MTDSARTEEIKVTQFAKLYDSPTVGQVLVKLDVNPDDTTPEVRFYVQPKQLGVCSIALGWPDTDDGWDKAEAAFAAVDEASAFEKAAIILKQAGELTVQE